MYNDDDIKDFAERVERVCDFFLAKIERDGSHDVRVIEDLKNDALHIQSSRNPLNLVTGLDDFMRGMPEKE